MFRLPTPMIRLPVLSALAAVCLLPACDRYPWDPPKPTVDTTGSAQRDHPPAAALPLRASRQGVLGLPTVPQDPGSNRDAPQAPYSRPLQGLL